LLLFLHDVAAHLPAFYFPLCNRFVDRYVVAPDEKQATFTGAQQRAGVPILAFLIAGLFSRLDRHEQVPAPHNTQHTPLPPDTPNNAPARGAAASASGAAAGDQQPDEEDTGDEAAQHLDDDDDSSDEDTSYKLDKNFVYDWGAYHAAFGDKPWEDAATEMFCEYAVLYGRISGHVGASLPTPMTLTKAASINQQASDFVMKFVTPILGRLFSTKFHKVLRHILDAVRLHGNLRNGNTSANEAYHKAD